MVGDAYSALTGFIGYDPIAGVALSEVERAAAIASAFVIGGGFHLLGRMASAVPDAARLGRSADNLADVGARTISSSAPGNPAPIIREMGDLSARQRGLLDSLPNVGSSVVVAKKAVNIRDLAALTAKTGDEFAMLTNGARRMIVRGSPTRVPIDERMAAELGSSGWRLSAHTHPGVVEAVLQSSDGDHAVLKAFGQHNSVVINSRGGYRVFDERGGW